MEIDLKAKPLVILVMGGPASGKGTYCAKLSSEFGLIHLSIGDILREERKKQTSEGSDLNKHMVEFEETGKLMSCEIVAHFIFKEMKAKGWNQSAFLIDGFIKAVAGYHYWMDKIDEKVNLKFVLYLECSPACMLQRMKSRAETSGRLDDNENIFDIRVKTFFKRTLPAIELMAGYGIVRKVSTEYEMEKVYSQIRDAFFNFFPEFKY